MTPATSGCSTGSARLLRCATSVPSRSTNNTLRMESVPRAGYGLQQQVVIGGPPDGDAHAVREQRIVERAHEDVGAARRLAERLAVACPHEHEVGIAGI